ncbi:EF-P lysine aminoacylase EpmA [Bdellovibrio sp. HCB337]|uniref:EF-P lysine aminoacylase EpmA n=1 Tax=Bdellovibrio sp. HCB337 TaxID=3394358 RepID=UPI0039A41F75
MLTREGKNHSRIFSKLYFTEDASLSVQTLLAPGDLVAVADNGEITLLAPALQKLPERYLQVDLLKQWQEFLYWVREFFKEQGFVEIQTPGLVTCPGTEPSLDVFSTDLVLGSRREKLYLPTSPELHLKKALALGAEKIFEIKKCYRNGEVTTHHQPEFTMIEWYRAFDNLASIKKDVAELVKYLGSKMSSVNGPKAVDSFTIAQLFKRDCGFELVPETNKEQLRELATKLGVDVSSATQIDDYFFLLFLEKIESQLPTEHMTFVENYPPYQAALARLTEDGWGDRFEVYWQGLELANAFHELNDAKVQAERFKEDLAKKKAMGKEMIPLDEEFLQCLQAGMPPSGGIALGLDRLFMALTGVSKISETRLFPMK